MEQVKKTCNECVHYDACLAMLKVSGYILPENHVADAARCNNFLNKSSVIISSCELVQVLDALKQNVAALCQERDALQRRCDDLEKSRQAWVMKCEALIGQLQETMEEREKLKGLADNYLKEYYKLEGEYDELILHPWKNLWRHIKEALGLA